MKNQPDFERPELLVAELLRRFPARKRLSANTLADRFHQRYGKSCARWMVRRGLAALLEQHCPDLRSKAEASATTLPNAPAEENAS